MMRTLRTRFLVLTILCGLLVAITACGDDDNPYSPPPDPDAIATDLTDPAEVIEAHAKALTKKNYAAFEALLDADFEFFPREEDAVDFPWMTGTSWTRTEELNIISHMFDPNFAGERPISAIEVNIMILSQQPLSEGRIALDCTFHGRVLTSPTDGWSFDTRHLYEVIPRGEFLRIVKITEIPRTRRGGTSVDESFHRSGGNRSASVDDTSWGSIKNLYR